MLPREHRVERCKEAKSIQGALPARRLVLPSPGLFTQVILSKAKDLPRLRLRQILRYAQNDRNALFMNNPG